MKNSNGDSNNFLLDILHWFLKVDSWRQLINILILTTWFTFVYDVVVNKGEYQRGIFTTFVGASRRPVLFAEDYTFINELLKKNPDANISVIEVTYLAGVASKPLTDLTKTEKITLNKAGVPVAVVLISPTTPPAVKGELKRYFIGNENLGPVVPFKETPNADGKFNPAITRPSRPTVAEP